MPLAGEVIVTGGGVAAGKPLGGGLAAAVAGTGGRICWGALMSTKPGLPLGQLPVVAIVPDIDFVGHALGIAFGVKGDRAEHRRRPRKREYKRPSRRGRPQG
jgi:hypothetical protein